MNLNTLSDLNIASAYPGSESLLNKFDFTRNDKAKEKLSAFLSGPPLCKADILDFQATINFVIANVKSLSLHVTNSDVYYTMAYLNYDKATPRHDGMYDKAVQLLKKTIRNSSHINFINSGAIGLVILLSQKWSILKNIHTTGCPPALKENLTFISDLVSSLKIEELKTGAYAGEIPLLKLLELDDQFRVHKKEAVLKLLDIFYELDALSSVAQAVTRFNLVFPDINDNNTISIKGLSHPFVNNCIKNDVVINNTENLLFLTGPNMSGKSTFLKSIGLTIYLALRGMAVPAESASIPVFDEVLIHINTQDNVFSGDSYFMAELKKVKEMALRLNEGRRCFVIFDELFKGTNFIDSMECSKLVIAGLTGFPSSKFIISTHMIGLYQEVEKQAFSKSLHLETTVESGAPVFSYKLKEGVSHVRIGLYLLEKQGIKELLFKSKENEGDVLPS